MGKSKKESVAAEVVFEAAAEIIDVTQDEIDAEKAAEIAADINSADPVLYVNKSRENLYTEAGRCRPDETVRVTPAQAEKYKGLEICPV